MKCFCNGKARLLSLLLGLVLLVGMLPMTAFALSIDASASNIQYYESGSLKSMDVSVKSNGWYDTAYGKIAVHKAKSAYSFSNRFVYSKDAAQWPESFTKDTSFVAMGSGEEFLWSNNKLHTRTIYFEDNVVTPGENNTENTYYVYLWTRAEAYGIYPDHLIATIKFGNELTFNTEPVDPPHAHSWVPATSGNGTKEATADVICSCGDMLHVSLTAEDVTLPGNVFTAKVTKQFGKEGRSAVPRTLTVSETPGYKHSATGANYETADPSSFEAKPGYYQASILVMDGQAEVVNLFVNYTVSDPAVTAATGDNRPVEIMFLGMAIFSILAAAAFVFDGKRMVRR